MKYLSFLLLFLTSFSLQGANGGFNKIRFDEDWSQFTAEADGPLLEQLKNVPITEDKSSRLSFGGHARLRMESWDNFAFAPASDDSFTLTRLFLHGDAHFSETMRAFVEFKSCHSSSRTLPGGKRTRDVDALDIHNCFLDYKIVDQADLGLWGRVGRQEISLGKERLFSPNYWANSKQVWDGANLIAKYSDWKVQAFLLQLVNVRKYELNHASHIKAYGLYGEYPFSNDIQLDVYWIGTYRKKVAFGAATGTDRRWTLGIALNGGVEGTAISYDVEGAYQSGKLGTMDVRATMLAGKVNYKVQNSTYGLVAFAGIDFASGGDTTATKSRTFNQLFPLEHAYLGYADLVGRQNVMAYHVGIKASPFAKAIFVGQYFVFRRESNTDDLYAGNGTILRAGTLSTSKDVGGELDLLLKYKYSKNIQLLVGYTVFQPGDFIKQATPSASTKVHFTYAGAQFTF